MKYFAFFLVLVGSSGFIVSHAYGAYVEFDNGKDRLLVNNKHIVDFQLDWGSANDLPSGKITFDKTINETLLIKIPKSIPRTTNLDFGSSLYAIQTDGSWEMIRETESMCFYVLEIPVTGSDYLEIESVSAAAGRWEPVAIDNEECSGVHDKTTQNESVFPRHGFHVSEMPPLKQLKSGIQSDEVQCKPNLTPVQKHDGSPACVKPLTAEKLVKRGWTINEDSESLNKKWGQLYLEYQLLKKSFSDHPNNMTAIERMIEIDDETMRIATILSERGFTIDIPETEPEKTGGTFYPRVHISIFPATESTQYVEPDFVTIGPGSHVTWSNYDDVPVSLNSIDPDNAWATSIIQPDGYDTVTFEETGIYEYKGNEGIHGFVIVMDDGGQLLESMFGEVFGNGSPLMFNDGQEPVLLYDNCKRYVYWLNEHGHEKIHVPEDYPNHSPWGNQIFSLVEFCTSNGNIVNAGDENSVRWKFEMENEN